MYLNDVNILFSMLETLPQLSNLQVEGTNLLGLAIHYQ